MDPLGATALVEKSIMNACLQVFLQQWCNFINQLISLGIFHSKHTPLVPKCLQVPTSNGKIVTAILSVYDLPADEMSTLVYMYYVEGKGYVGHNKNSMGFHHCSPKPAS